MYMSQVGTAGLAVLVRVFSAGRLRECSQEDRRLNARRIQPVSYKGFTLLELVLVMVILSTVLAMAAPSLRGFFASRQTQDAAAQILSLTQLARSRAVCEGTAYRLNLDDKQGEYWLTSQQSGAFEKLKTDFGQVFTLPKDTVLELEGVEQDQSETFIAFTPQGTTTAATIRLIDRRGQAVVITCPAATESFHIVIGEQDNGTRI
jgi:prepilin-type N-terminal cleavage/methylation domain-containing protein